MFLLYITGEFGSAPLGLVALPRRCKLQRLVRERALVQAFSKVLLILLGTHGPTAAVLLRQCLSSPAGFSAGEDKVMLEVKHSPDQLPPVLTEEIVQVKSPAVSC